ncbi:MAG: transketolase-like TK C-terminal-containing protein [Propylenella sp.]
MSDPREPFLAALEKKALWLATWTIHNANHLRDSSDGLKVGGHQASSASLATIMAVLYGAILRPEDRVAVKPHASPIFHALQYLFGLQTREKLENFRGYKGAQSYPSRTKDVDDVDFSTGSVGLGAAQTIFSSLVQDYVRAKGWSKRAVGRMVALVGDAEMDEGNIFEALLEGWKHGLQNCWWVIDYNRQSLDAVVREGLWERFETLFRDFGWDVVILKYGSLLQEAFKEEGGENLRAWIDDCPNQVYSLLCFQGGAAWRKRLLVALGDQGPVSRLIERRSDDGLARLMTNLAGHDIPTLLDAFERASSDDRPKCFIAYTIKGFGLPLQGHKDNHAGLMTLAQMEAWREKMGIAPGEEWAPYAALGIDTVAFQDFLAQAPFVRGGRRRLKAARIPVPASLPIPPSAAMSTQHGFGLILSNLARTSEPLVTRIVTASPDVTVSTNLGGFVNRRGLFAKDSVADQFRKERIPSTYTWEFSPAGQHFELGIAENNLFTLLSALGLAHSIEGERLIPIGTLYDPFIYRGADALNYACYQDARFILVATPSGISLAPEGGAHQSIGTPLLGIAQDGLSAFEPAFVDEVAVILRWAFDYLQRTGEGDPDERTWLRDETGGSVYLRLSTRPIEQIGREMTETLATDIVNGAYWMRRPGPNAQVAIIYQGAVAPEAMSAAGLLGEDRRDIGVLSVTSADRLNAGWQAAERARQRGTVNAMSHVERLLAPLSRDCGLVTVIDGHPATLSWIGGVYGHRVKSLGVEHFGQTGSIEDLYRHYGIDANAIAHAAQAVSRGRPVRHLVALP